MCPAVYFRAKIRLSKSDHACLREAVFDGLQRAAYFSFPSYLLIDDSESQCAFTWREARSNFRDGIGDRHRVLETARVTVEDY
jgi:hypothetical protein